MAEQLNTFVCSVFTNEDCTENLFHGDHALLDTEITEDKVRVKLERLKPNSAPGPDKLWPRVLQKLSSVLAQPLAIVYTRCLSEGTVPPEWKLANVSPIFKKGVKGLCRELQTCVPHMCPLQSDGEHCKRCYCDPPK